MHAAALFSVRIICLQCQSLFLNGIGNAWSNNSHVQLLANCVLILYIFFHHKLVNATIISLLFSGVITTERNYFFGDHLL